MLKRSQRQASAWLSTVAPQPSRVMTDVASSEDSEEEEAASNSAWLSTAAPNHVASDEEVGIRMVS